MRSSVAALLLILAPSLVSAAVRYDPRLRFRTWRTAHFDIHAHQGEAAMARRLGVIAERVRARLEPSLGVPRGRVQVILVDQTDVANGWATPFPYNVIEISAAAPPGEESIGNTTDWLELVFTHEYTHIVHLDRSLGFMGGVRKVFGRAPLVFPNLFLPAWQIEGLATYEESRMTGQGRVPAGDFSALVDVAARHRRFDPIDRAAGGLDDWPGGNAAYAYGAYFHQYLAERFGADRVDALADATARRLPLLGAGAFGSTLGAPLTALWSDFRASREAAAAAALSVSDPIARRLTHDGFVVAAPRVGGDGALYYRTSNADGFPALMRLEGGRTRRLAWRVHGMRTAVRGDWAVFDQLERVRSVAIHSDLYAVRTTGGSVVRLTKNARASHPDLSPDGRRIACVVQAADRRVLAVLDFTPGRPAVPRVIVDEPGTDFAGPRWSPDGTRIVAERRRADGHELVLVDPDGGALRSLIARRDTRLVTPSWSPDGGTVFFAANVGRAPFNVHAIDVRSGDARRVTDSASGAQSPEIAPDGSLIYVGYTPEGRDLFSLPAAFRLDGESRSLDEISGVKAGAIERPAGDPSQPHIPERDERLDGEAYNPLRTLVPTYWAPVLETDAGETLAGAETGVSDALGRHAYSARALWSGSRGRPDWSVGYAYDRWRPTIVASYSDDTDPIAGGVVRSREIFAGAQIAFRRFRWSQTLMAGFDADTQTATCTGSCRVGRASRTLRSMRAGWRYDTRRQFSYSISSEEGVVIEAAVDGSRRALGSDADATAVIADLRAFQRVFGRHVVLAVRAAGASSWGDAAGRRLFSAAGAGASATAFDFGRNAIGLLRGFDDTDVVGPNAAVVNADVRLPLARVQRGPGLWPVFVRSLHAAAFVDLGHAWDATFRAADVRRAIGGEIASDLVLIHYLPVTVAGGVAWTHDPVADRDRAAGFVRFSYAF